VPAIGRDNPPDIAPEHLGPAEFGADPEAGFELANVLLPDCKLERNSDLSEAR
jgi:hypothetical protein